jgi:NADPH:quinone reductase-like Zn-dependent oxidoreductase
LGSDLSGVVEALGPGVTQCKPGDEIYGVTNSDFIGACAEFALASSKMTARKPACLNFTEAASVPVVAVTAWQMLFEYAQAQPNQIVLILGAAGNVGGYAIQFAKQAGLHVFATASEDDSPYVQRLGATTVIDYKRERLEEAMPMADVVLDLVGGETQERSLKIIKPGGILVSVVSKPIPRPADRKDIRAIFFLAEVTTARLDRITNFFNEGMLIPRVGTVVPLDDVRMAHQMLAGAPHKPGKIVLTIADMASSSPKNN